MRTIFLLFCFVLFLVGCEKESPYATFPVETTSVELEADGGEFTINYDMPPALSGDGTVDIVIRLQSGANDWIKLVSSDRSKATFAVRRNNQPFVRSAIIQFKNNAYDEYASVTVSQGCIDHNIDIELNEVTTSTVNATIVSEDTNLYLATFIVAMTPNRDNIDNLLLDGDKLLNRLKDDVVRNANDRGEDLKQYMLDRGHCGVGSLVYHRTTLEPGVKHCMVVIGVEFVTDEDGYQTLAAVTPPASLYFVTEPSPIREDITIDATVAIDQNYGSDILLSVECDKDSGLLYRYMLFDAADSNPYIFEEHTPEEFHAYYSALWYDDFMRELALGMESLEAYLNETTFSGTLVDERIRLAANSDYCLVVYALDVVDGIIQMVSYPEIEYFTTEQPGLSDITFDYSINTLYGRKINYTITPSNDLDGYYSTVVSKQEYESWNEALLHQKLVDEGWANQNVYFGSADVELETLSPLTEYYIVCVGVHGGVATSTTITRFPIVTPEQDEPKCKLVDFEILGPYHMSAIYNTNPSKYPEFYDWPIFDTDGYYIVGTVNTFEGEPYRLYATYLSDYDLKGVDSEEDLISVMRTHPNAQKCFFYCMRNTPLRYCVMVMDEDANIDLYISPEDEKYIFTAESLLTSEEDIARLVDHYEEFKVLREEALSKYNTRACGPSGNVACVSLNY